MLMEMQIKKAWWKIPLGIVIIAVVGVSLYSVFYSPDTKDPEPVQRAAATAPENSDESVLSESVDISSGAAIVYEQAISKAEAHCEESGIASGTTAFDTCVEYETSQIAH